MLQPKTSSPHPLRIHTGRSTRLHALSLGLLGLLATGCSLSSKDDRATDGSTETAGVDDSTTMDPASTEDTDDGTTGEPNTNECDVWAQDCPDGEKCVPWADDGGNTWNALRCAPVNGNGQPGDTCMLMGGEITGLDDCAHGSICMRLDDGTDNGVCVPQCEGTVESPSCADSGRECINSNDGVMTLCMESCDPIVGGCPPGMGCYPQWEANTYVCWPDFSGEFGAYGDTCMYTNGCDPGLMCWYPEGVPGCEGSACCTDYCNMDDPDPDAQCLGQAEGQVCQPLDLGGGAVPGLEHLGICEIPT